MTPRYGARTPMGCLAGVPAAGSRGIDDKPLLEAFLRHVTLEETLGEGGTADVPQTYKEHPGRPVGGERWKMHGSHGLLA